MPWWKWFLRRDKPIDAVGPATSYPHRAGAYGHLDDRPAWATEPTVPQPQVRPLLTRGQKHRSGGPPADS
ncbi:hypothetical protein [Micromonospora sp. NPDC049679]|uniref:hypothetical protein n=1 Tax=Micromonospora sp. NPDC049679 TaxID=3155920 RepID=UPI00340B1524